MNDKLFRMIGLAYRAGKAEAGEAKAEDRLRYKKSKLIIISEDASENTAKKFKNLCKACNVRLIQTGTREILGNYAGRDFAVVISVNDEGFARAIGEIADSTANL